MEPITFTAIVAAIAVTVAKGAGEAVGQNVVNDAYTKLKAVLMRKFGRDSDLVQSVEGLEAKPESEARKLLVEEEVRGAEADKDAEVREAAEELLELLRAQLGGEQHVQSIIGNYNAQADRGSTAEVRVNQPEERQGA
ncbi:MAG: hypothetical protein M3R38_09180 [Actinomycetota bacterium]|nr:hypothetical protein [Actinomycetota bacterium]PLS85526.1 MAG: hypothetical protein CYG60_12085 [Actinomycetota bacterium]